MVVAVSMDATITLDEDATVVDTAATKITILVEEEEDVPTTIGTAAAVLHQKFEACWELLEILRIGYRRVVNFPMGCLASKHKLNACTGAPITVQLTEALIPLNHNSDTFLPC